MLSITITPTQSIIATTLIHHTASIFTLSDTALGLANGGGEGGGGGGGGRGGGGGGGVPTPAPATLAATIIPIHYSRKKSQTKRKKPMIFTKDQGKADKFMHELKLYQFLNGATPLMQDLYWKVAHALTFIQGPAVTKWKCSMEN